MKLLVTLGTQPAHLERLAVIVVVSLSRLSPAHLAGFPDQAATAKGIPDGIDGLDFLREGVALVAIVASLGGLANR